MGPQQFDAPKDLIAEADNLGLLHHRTVVDEAEKRLIGKRYPKRKYFGSGKNPGDDIIGYGL